MVTSGWWEDKMNGKEEWRYAYTEYGALCAASIGMYEMLILSAVSWLRQEVVQEFPFVSLHATYLHNSNTGSDNCDTTLVELVRASVFGGFIAERRPIFFKEFHCTSNDTRLIDCIKQTYTGDSECTRRSDAGVVCQGKRVRVAINDMTILGYNDAQN